MKDEILEKIEYSTAGFISEYMNDHSGNPRWLRGIFFTEEEKIEKILEYMRGIENLLAIEKEELDGQWRDKIILRKVCMNCGKDKNSDGLTDMCNECLEEA